MAKGDLAIAVLPGDYGKQRPVLIIQSSLLNELPSTVVCPITSHIEERIQILHVIIEPTRFNGLKERSHVVVDKITAIPTAKITQIIGQADVQTMQHVKQAVAVLLDFS